MANAAQMIVTLDRVQGTSYDSNLQQTIIYRGFVATQLPAGVGPDTIRQAIVGPGGLPPVNTPHPTQNGAFVIGHSIRLIGDTQADGFVKYAGSTFVNKFQFSRHSYLQSIQTEIDPIYPAPGGGAQISVNLNGGPGNAKVIYGADGGTLIGYIQGTAQPGHVSYLRPMAVFKATGVFTNAPSALSQAVMGCVNEKTFLGLGPGYWLCNDYSFNSEDLGTTFNVQIQLISLVNEDWSSYLVATNQVDGRPLSIPATTITQLKNKPYNITPDMENNISKYGLYSTVSYDARLGFQGQSSYLNQFSF